MHPVKLSKFLSLVLRHDPARIGISLDDAGWTDVPALLAAALTHGVTITREDLVEIVRTSDKQRFALSEDGTRIRANQGHSVEVDLQLAEATPPPRLYHGTIEDVLASIREQGLVKGARHHVHLSADIQTATKVGARRGAPVVLMIRADDMVAMGHAFFRSDNGVWLTEHVPPQFIEHAPLHGAGRGSRSAKVTIAKQTLAACDAGHYTNPAGAVVDLASAIDEAVRGTVAYALGDDLAPAIDRRAPTPIHATIESTVEAIVRLSPRGDHVACLNFASAKNPGGGFLNGAQAQEESLARSSALYPCLLGHPEHYEQNRAHRDAGYLDLALWSPHVPFFRDDDGGWLDRPVLASVITCAAPNAAALRKHDRFDPDRIESVLRRRAAFVLAIAAHHRVDTLVLGAWGAGVFGNDPEIVAQIFGALLSGPFARAFATVVFAVLPGPNHAPFAARFR